ncbi:hypothetical protein Glove_130g29 [Diversispora epigaea]|uniref:Uncharacterized protein n=1 Tax=Diversispora epigaea TaxID=1348612 RepID=A0A397IY79_9GLOM|nr:hypothetical protein Glove_130g29 [Diversispora epigaea]
MRVRLLDTGRGEDLEEVAARSWWWMWWKGAVEVNLELEKDLNIRAASGTMVSHVAEIVSQVMMVMIFLFIIHDHDTKGNIGNITTTVKKLKPQYFIDVKLWKLERSKGIND